MNNEIKLKIKQSLPWIVRVLVFAIFMLSGIAKLIPVWAFEKQLVDLGITSWSYAPYLARLIIAFEIAIGVAILQSHYLKRIVIPATILLLLAFCIHLLILMFQNGALSGNCGCFGQLIPMSPLEAFIKNIVTIGLLVYMYFNVRDKEKDKNKFTYLVLIYLASALIMFMFFPFCPNKDTAWTRPFTYNPDTIKQTTIINHSTVIEKKNPTNVFHKDQGKNSVTKNEAPAMQPAVSVPKHVKSRFSRFTAFENETVNLDDGKKILCFFVPGCDECREAAKQINLLSKEIQLPPVYILFMNEETDKIPDFFMEANVRYPYTVIEVPVFWDLFGMNANTPGVFYLWNGNIMRFYEGSDGNKFNSEDFRKAISQS